MGYNQQFDNQQFDKTSVNIANIIPERLRSSRRKNDKPYIENVVKSYLTMIIEFSDKNTKIHIVKKMFKFLINNVSYIHNNPAFKKIIYEKLDEFKKEDSLKNYCTYVKLMM